MRPWEPMARCIDVWHRYTEVAFAVEVVTLQEGMSRQFRCRALSSTILRCSRYPLDIVSFCRIICGKRPLMTTCADYSHVGSLSLISCIKLKRTILTIQTLKNLSMCLRLRAAEHLQPSHEKDAGDCEFFRLRQL